MDTAGGPAPPEEYPTSAVAGAAFATLFFPVISLIVALLLVGRQPEERKRSQLRMWAWASAVWIAVQVSSVALFLMAWSSSGGSAQGGEPLAAKPSSTTTPAATEVVGRHLLLPTRTLNVKGAFRGIAAGSGRAMPLLIQPRPCGRAPMWDALHDSVVKVQPWPRCQAKRAEIVQLAAGFDSYWLEGAITGRLVSVAARWNVSDSCTKVLNRLVLPNSEGETLGTFESGCYDVGQWGPKEKSVGLFTPTGRSVAFNVWSAHRGIGRRQTMNYPAVSIMAKTGAPRQLKGLKGLLVDGQRNKLLLQRGKDLVLWSLESRGVTDSRAFHDVETGQLAGRLAVIQQGPEIHVYDSPSGEQIDTWRLQQDPFQVPKDPDYAPTKTPSPVLLDAWRDLVLYETGRQIRLLRLSDGYDGIIAQGRFEKKYQQFPFLDAAIDRVGLLYAVSTSSNGDYSWPYGDGTISFVTSEALERALP